MTFLFLALALVSPSLAEVPSDCGHELPAVPAFSLVDSNPGSPTSGQSLGPADFEGQARIVYFAHAGCGVCQSHVAELQEIWDEKASAWTGQVQLLVINMPGYESYLPDLVEGITLPVLQDTNTDLVSEGMGAYKWYVYFVDAEGTVRWVHYYLDLPGSERDRFITEVDGLLEAK